MADSADLDDLPDLVESSDEDSPAEKKSKKTNVEFATSWLNKGSKFLEKQELWMRIFSLCPFLFGINNIVSVAWMKALHTAKLLLNEKRQYELTYLEWQEWECVDLMDHIIPKVQDRMRKKEVLYRCLDCVDVLEDCKKGVIIDVKLAIEAAKKYEEVSDLWTDVLKDRVCNGKEIAARFGVLYVIKLYHCHVISIEVNGKDFVEEKKREYKNSNASRKAEDLKKEGNVHFTQSNYRESIKCYTSAIKTDPLHHIYFSNRAQAYHKLKEFNEALADGRRAVTIKPDFSKGHYRYGQAFHELGQLDAAIKVNKRGLQLCEKSRSTDYSNVKELEDQGQRFALVRIEEKRPLTSIPKALEKKLDSIADSLDDLNKKFGIEEPPKLVSSDSESDSVPPPTQETKSKKKNKSKAQKHERAKQEKVRQEKVRQDQEKAILEQHEKLKQDRPWEKPVFAKLSCKPGSPPKQFKPYKNFDKIIEILQMPNIGPGSLYVRTAIRFGSDPDSATGMQIQQSHAKQRNRTRFEEILDAGSKALLKNVNKTAIVNFKKALDVMALTEDISHFGMDQADILTLKYAYGIAAVGTGNHRNILDGMEKFKEILEVEAKYPMAYYGLGKAYITMNRFILALVKLQEGYTLVEKIDQGLGVTSNCVFWPGTETVIEESNLKNLKLLLEDLIQLCHFPPPPDGICRHHTDKTDSRTDIYRTDPDFKGLYQIFCQMGCTVSFHPNCWKDYKAEHNTNIDKEILDTLCVTPDCSGFIIKITIEKDLDTKREFFSEKHTAKVKHTKEKKPVVKMKSTSDHKLAKKKDRKDLRKQRRRERLEEKDDLQEDDEKHADPNIHVPDMTGSEFNEAAEGYEEKRTEPNPLPNEKETVVLKKEEIAVTKAPGKQKKQKKKKEKSRQLLTLEVNFSDRKEESLLGESSAISDDEKIDKVKPKSAAGKSGLLPTPGLLPTLQTTPGLLPTPQTVNVPTENLQTVPSKLKTDDITENLLSYFSDILKAHGPLPVDDIKIQQELEVFPLEAQEKIKLAGGLGDFLRQDFKFAVIDDVISLMTDAVKAREIALVRRDERVNQGKQPQTQNAWKTVGRGNDVDSLQESVTDSANSGKSSYVSVAANTANKSMTASKDASHLPVVSDSSGKNTVSLANSNSSNSLSSVDSSVAPVKHLSEKSSVYKHSEAPAEELFRNVQNEKVNGFNMDTLDSIDDFPLPKTLSDHEVKSKLDDLDDFDVYPYSPSSAAGKDSKLSKKGKPMFPPDTAGSIYISDSSSDISETSDISIDTPKLVVGGMPKPLKPLNRFGQGLTPAPVTEFESDTQGSVVSVDSEIKRLADDFIKKSDEKLMSEIADSVVEQIYIGKSVSEVERANTLKQVSADIREDFEKSARSGSLTGSGIWADTPASADYSKNIGKFASDFMKSHYQKENIVFSPTSDPSLLSSQNSHSTIDSDFKINSPFDKTNETDIDRLKSFSSNFTLSQASTSQSSGYNLFSGISLGLDSFSSQKSNTPHLQRPPLPFVPPPPAATGFYSSVPPPLPIGSQPRPPLTPLRMPSFHTALKIDKETQVENVVYASVETMTETSEMVEIQHFVEAKEHFERVKIQTEQFKEKVREEMKILQGKNEEQDNQILSLVKQLEAKKTAWTKEKESLQELIDKLREKLADKQKTESELKQKMTAAEKQLKELTKQMNQQIQQREKDKQEIKKYKDEAKQHQNSSEQQRERAKAAEVEILKSKLAAAVKMLERSQKEAVFHVRNLEGFIKKHEEESKPVPVPLKQCLDHWSSVAEKCDGALAKVKSDYEAQIEEISNGKLLSEFSPITIPSPPPIPDAIKSFMMMPHPNNLQGKMPPPAVMPRQPHPFGPRPPPPNNMLAGNASGFSGPVMTRPSPVSQPQPLVPPRPLQGAAGVPPRPLSGARPPLLNPVRPSLRPQGPATTGPKTSFEKLMLKLQMDFPNHNRDDFNRYIQILRTRRGGSLSGVSMQDIISQVSEMIKEIDRQATSANKTSQGSESSEKPVAPPPGLSASWAFHTPVSSHSGRSESTEMFEEDEDPCAICHEELSAGTVNTLECTHKFHDECIRKWFREQSTCPNCRVHSLLSDEFPSLG